MNWERNHTQPAVRFLPAIEQFLGYWVGKTPETLRERLKDARHRAGMTQVEFGALIGVDESSLRIWEGGWRQPTRGVTVRLTAALDTLDQIRIAGSSPGQDGQAAGGRAQPTFSDLTRWSRKPLPELLQVKPKTLGERLRHRRLELGLSQAEVGNRFGIGRASIGRWERGEDPVPRRHRDALLGFIDRHA